MNPDPPVYFQWQNPVLRRTIYPFREKKLLDFLLIYKEIDLWKAMGKSPVDPKIAAELIQENSRYQNLLTQAQKSREQTQYMVIHFSGMRYQSAHPSWANPRDLLESLKTEELKQKNRSTSTVDLDQEITQAVASLRQAKIGITDLQQVGQIEKQITALTNQYTRQRVRQIATRLDTSTNTISSHLRDSTHKFDAKSREDMCAMLADWDFSEYEKKPKGSKK